MILPIVLFLLFMSYPDNQAMQEDISEVKRRAEEYGRALIADQYENVVKLTYPIIIKNIGGDQKMIEVLIKGRKEMRSMGYDFSSITVGSSIEITRVQQKRFAVIPYTLKMKAPGGVLIKDSYLVGIDTQTNVGWTFIDGGTLDDSRLKLVIPEAVGKIRLPASRPPTFEKS